MVILIDEKDKKYETRGNAADFVDFLRKIQEVKKLDVSWMIWKYQP